MYIIKPSADVCGKKAGCTAGYPEDTYPDLCFCNTNFSSCYTAINSKVLIHGLLNSPELLAKLGYKIVPVEEQDENKPTPIPPYEMEEPQVAPTEDAPTSEQPETTLPQKRVYTDDEKLVLTAARKSYQREYNCTQAQAKAYVSEHADEYLAAARERGELQ